MPTARGIPPLKGWAEVKNRRYPFDEMDSLMDRMFRNMWGDFGPDQEGERRMGRADVHLDIERDEAGYVVLADLPGFEKEEISLSYDDGYLTIEASHEVEEGDEHVRYSRSRSAYERVRVPGDAVRADDISATYRNGVLEVHIPVEEMRDDAHQIDID
jgi:HSP20 family protein